MVADDPGDVGSRPTALGRFDARVITASRAAAALTALIAAVALTGWTSGHLVLASVLPDETTMKPITAISFAGLAGACWLVTTSRHGLQRLGRGVAWAVMPLPVLTLVETAMDKNLGIDEVVFRSRVREEIVVHPGRMATMTAITLTLIGAGLIVSRRRPSFTTAAAAVTTLLGTIAVLGYAFDAPPLYRLQSYNSMALPTAVAIMTLGIGLTLTQPHRGLLGVAGSETLGGTMVRRVMPSILLIEVAVAAAVVTGQSRSWYSSQFGLAMFVAATLAVTVGVLWRTGIALVAVDSERANLLRTLESRVQARTAQLHDEVELRRQILSTATDAFVSLDEHGVVVDWNQRSEIIFGYAAADVIGSPVEEVLFDTAVAAKLRDALTTARTSDAGWTGQFRARHRDGHWVPVEASVWATHTQSGFTINAFIRDISDRVAAQEAGARYESVFENSGDAIMVIDREGLVVSWNPSAERIYGYSADEIIGRSAVDLLLVDHDDEREATARLSAGLMAPGEVASRRKDGSVITLSITRSPIADRNGTIVGISCIARDVTERNRTMAELEQRTAELAAANEELARSNAHLDEFASVAAHDLKSPLATVAGFATMLESGMAGELNPDAQECATYLVRGVRQMQTLVDDLLAFARVGTTAERVRVSMTAVAEDVRLSLKADLEATNAEVIFAELPDVMGDAGQLRQLLANLVGNGVKFHRPGVAPVVTVTAVARDGRWELRVADNGIGIEPRSRERIFKMFQRLHSADDYAGTGIGLAICRRVVENHGGRIWIEDGPGGGSVFCFDLPAAASPAPGEVRRQSAAATNKTPHEPKPVRGRVRSGRP